MTHRVFERTMRRYYLFQDYIDPLLIYLYPKQNEGHTRDYYRVDRLTSSGDYITFKHTPLLASGSYGKPQTITLHRKHIRKISIF